VPVPPHQAHERRPDRGERAIEEVGELGARVDKHSRRWDLHRLPGDHDADEPDEVQ
jgi:hypothetical protein